MREFWFPATLAAFIIAFFGFVILAAIEDAKEWKAFAIAHNCKVVGRVAGSVSFGNVIGGKNNGAIIVNQEPDKTGYACDDGVTYWR